MTSASRGLCLVVLIAACATLPPPPPAAVFGRQLLADLSGLSLAQREAVVWREVERDNVPPFLLQMVPVTVTATVQGHERSATSLCARLLRPRHFDSVLPTRALRKGHTQGHVDYSHGLRLVAREMEVDGHATTVGLVLKDPELHILLSDEGPIPEPRYRGS